MLFRAEVVAWDVDIEEEEPSEEKGILIPGYTSTVSYTHLDVYKRQISFRLAMVSRIILDKSETSTSGT